METPRITAAITRYVDSVLYETEEQSAAWAALSERERLLVPDRYWPRS